MTIEEFHQSLKADTPPEGMSQLLLALWYDAKGNWAKSHDIASEINTKEGSLLHAYLHRKEGDLWNADYWYRRAKATPSKLTIREEWSELLEIFIAL